MNKNYGIHFVWLKFRSRVNGDRPAPRRADHLSERFMYHDDSNEPGEGSTDDLWAQATGTKKKKPKRKRVWKASADFKPRP